MVIDGKHIAEGIAERLGHSPKPKKFLAGILVGNDAPSKSFQKMKQTLAASLGVDYRIYEFSERLENNALTREVEKIAAQAACGGVIVQLPLPEHFDHYMVVDAIPAKKDPDVLGAAALGDFYNGRSKILHPAAATVDEILKQAKFKLKGKKVMVLGRGFLIGKPIAVWLMNQKAGEVTVLGRDGDLSVLKNADLVIGASGKPGIIKPAMLKDGAAVIDFGYQGGKGDFDPGSEKDASRLAFYTPTPRGTGPILVAKLIENFYKLNSFG